MNFEQNRYLKTKSRGIFYLVVLAVIAMSALLGACPGGGPELPLELSYSAVTGTAGTAINAVSPTWEGRPGERGDV